MKSSNPNTVRPLRDGLVPNASYVLDPRPLQDSPSDDLRLQLYNICYRGRRFIIFMSILLGDDEALNEGVTDNKNGACSGTNHDTMLYGGEFANPTTTLWLLKSLKSRGTTIGCKTNENFLKLMRYMKMVLQEVMKFGVRATNVAKAFAKMEFHLVKPLLLHLEDLRLALQQIVKDIETKLPIIDPFLPSSGPSNKFVLGASHILNPQPSRVGSNDDDFLLQLRASFYQFEQFHIFLSILLGEDQLLDEDAIVHNNGGALNGRDHYSLQPYGGELIVPTTTFWLHDYLKKRDAIPEYTGNHCWHQLKGPFKEVMKFGARATDVAKAFARMEIDHVEYLLIHPKDLWSTLQQFNTNVENKETKELIKMFMPDVEFDLSFHALPNELLPNIERMDDNYIKLRVLYYFSKIEDEWPKM